MTPLHDPFCSSEEPTVFCFISYRTFAWLSSIFLACCGVIHPLNPILVHSHLEMFRCFRNLYVSLWMSFIYLLFHALFCLDVLAISGFILFHFWLPNEYT